MKKQPGRGAHAAAIEIIHRRKENAEALLGTIRNNYIKEIAIELKANKDRIDLMICPVLPYKDLAQDPDGWCVKAVRLEGECLIFELEDGLQRRNEIDELEIDLESLHQVYYKIVSQLWTKNSETK